MIAISKVCRDVFCRRRPAVLVRPIGIGLCVVAFALALCGQTSPPPAQAPVVDVLQSLRLPSRERPPAPSNEPLSAPSAESLDLAAVARQLDARRKGFAASDYDFDACVAAIPKDLTSALNFVRDRIAFEIYPGVMRGAGWTFSAGAGNSYDRATLLAEILRRQGHTVRYAFGVLDQAHCEQLLERAFEPRRKRAPTGERTNRAQHFLDRLTARATRDYLAIRAALGADGFAQEAPTRSQLLTEISDHCWVQAQVGDAWVDLDSSLATAQVGQPLTTAANTVVELPLERMQRFAIRVVSEHLAAGKLQETRALECVVRADQLLDQHVFLFHVAEKRIGAAISKAMTGAADTAWLPVLWLQEETFVGESVQFSEGGETGGVLDALGGGESSDAPQLVAEWLELELLVPGRAPEVTRRALVDRAPCDWRTTAPLDASRLAPLARTADGPSAPQALHNLWFSAGGHNLLAYTETMYGLVQSQVLAQSAPPADGAQAATPSSEEPVAFFAQVMPTAIQNFTWLLWSDEFLVPALNDAPDQRFYPDSPRVWIFSATPGADGRSVVREMDLRRDRIRGVARTDSAAALLGERQLWFGVLEGALEHEAIAEQLIALRADPKSALSTSQLLESDGAFALRPADTHRVADFALAPEFAARARAALARGSTLVIPRGALRSSEGGWWEIDRAGQQVRPVASRDLYYGVFNDGNVGGKRPAGSGTGGTFEVGPDGRSRQIKGPQQYDPAKRNLPKRTGALQEYLALVMNAVENAPPYVKLGLAVGGAVAAAAAAAAVWP